GPQRQALFLRHRRRLFGQPESRRYGRRALSGPAGQRRRPRKGSRRAVGLSRNLARLLTRTGDPAIDCRKAMGAESRETTLALFIHPTQRNDRYRALTGEQAEPQGPKGPCTGMRPGREDG